MTGKPVSCAVIKAQGITTQSTAVKAARVSSKELFRKTSAIIVKKMGTATLTNSRETIASTVVSKDAQQLE